MLSKVTTTTASTVATTKTIAISKSGNSQNGAVMYTVPTGKKFKGLIGHSLNYYLSINSNEIGPFSNGTSLPWQASIELTAGAVVKAYVSTAGTSMLFGVESDA